MKVIWTDPYNRDTVPDRLVVDGLTAEQAKAVKKELLRHCPDYSSDWYTTVEDDYRLSRGMEDLV